MANQPLAVKYRPQKFDDVCEQESIKTILTQQLNSDSIKNCYLFCGPAGCGKTTCARIFAQEINHHQGNAIEIDAASNSGVESVESIIKQAKTKSLDSEYKVFILDECHSFSSAGWQKFLKTLEEPPAKSIFIFCTTDPQKIPKTILSRVQRYDFRRMSQDTIVNRLDYILLNEQEDDAAHDIEALDYIAKIADGGMRDAITLLDKCLAYSQDITINNVVKALGTTNYDMMIDLTKIILNKQSEQLIKFFEDLYREGQDLKTFIKMYMNFVLDLNKLRCTNSWTYVNIPSIYSDFIKSINQDDWWYLQDLLSVIISLNNDIKWDGTPKYTIQAKLLMECSRR